ncbi:hypothetical protein [Cryobacterium luteum]|uniref:Uncharacterized protein n=1 Tax=Cryobacterium luteum TaxID=1424661 RepID=A0A1H8KIJ5_9MICO|nr:hypothetical protein [Cryobacterium luteum]TFB89995.1 hypothetical protein E3O10_07720 [Cryobacterium luteum]SEN92790.1 hypothetical protein SAMN05216281_11958 [Cryobacterium luteum]
MACTTPRHVDNSSFYTESGQIIITIAGISLLAVGFAVLAGALLIYDPAASDAIIGAGLLKLTGLPFGILGLTS